MPRRAHTLWEMLVVLVVLGTAAAAVAPAAIARGRPALEDDVMQTTRELVGLLARARVEALERGATIELSLEPATARVWTFAVDGDGPRLLASGTMARAPGASLVADGARVRFVFHPSGAAAGGTVVVRGAGVARRVTVDPWSGVTDVQSR